MARGNPAALAEWKAKNPRAWRRAQIKGCAALRKHVSKNGSKASQSVCVKQARDARKRNVSVTLPRVSLCDAPSD